MILYYLLIIIIVIFIILRFYLKYKYGFWYHQPVFHLYDLHYYFYKPRIICPTLPFKNKYVNLYQIQTTQHFNKPEIIEFINNHYLTHKHNNFHINKPIYFQSYFENHNMPSFVSIFYDNIVTNTNTNKMQGLITCRPLYISFSESKSGSTSTNTKNIKNKKYICYYVDYLCVDKNFRKKGIAPQLIQTHEYNYRRFNTKIQISLFKREDELTGIVPLCAYDTFGFDVRNWTNQPPNNISAIYECISWNNKNIATFYALLKTIKNNHIFEALVYPEWSHLCHLVQTKNIWVYGIEMKNTRELQCLYFFRKSCTTINNGEVLSCFASIVLPSFNQDTFVQGFKIALYQIISSHSNNSNANNNLKQLPFHYLAIENISHNHQIIQSLQKIQEPFVISPTAYFLYNYISLSICANNVLILN